MGNREFISEELMFLSLKERYAKWHEIHEKLEEYHNFKIEDFYNIDMYKIELIDKKRKLDEVEQELYFNIKQLGKELEQLYKMEQRQLHEQRQFHEQRQRNYMIGGEYHG